MPYFFVTASGRLPLPVSVVGGLGVIAFSVGVSLEGVSLPAVGVASVTIWGVGSEVISRFREVSETSDPWNVLMAFAKSALFTNWVERRLSSNCSIIDTSERLSNTFGCPTEIPLPESWAESAQGRNRKRHAKKKYALMEGRKSRMVSLVTRK